VVRLKVAEVEADKGKAENEDDNDRGENGDPPNARGEVRGEDLTISAHDPQTILLVAIEVSDLVNRETTYNKPFLMLDPGLINTSTSDEAINGSVDLRVHTALGSTRRIQHPSLLSKKDGSIGTTELLVGEGLIKLRVKSLFHHRFGHEVLPFNLELREQNELSASVAMRASHVTLTMASIALSPTVT